MSRNVGHSLTRVVVCPRSVVWGRYLVGASSMLVDLPDIRMACDAAPATGSPVRIGVTECAEARKDCRS